jgi:hypothetical protein
MAIEESRKRPPSEKESGVVLITPNTTGDVIEPRAEGSPPSLVESRFAVT